jgi:hypothetical protein
MLWHFSCDRMAWARQIMELCFCFFRSHHSFYQASNSASVDCSTSINIAKTLVGISYWLFIGNQGFYHSTLFVLHIINWPLFEALLHWCCTWEIFTASHVNARNFKFVSSNISHA